MKKRSVVIRVLSLVMAALMVFCVSSSSIKVSAEDLSEFYRNASEITDESCEHNWRLNGAIGYGNIYFEQYVCRNCHSVQYVEMTDGYCHHTNTYENRTEPTYENDGYTETICRNCGETVSSETLPKLACSHAYVESIISNPDCTHAGEKQLICSVCGDSYTETIPAFGHTPVDSVVSYASCKNAGSKVTKCSSCGEILNTETTPKLEHVLKETVITEAKYKKDGSKKITCANCDYEKTVTIPALTECPHEKSIRVRVHDPETNTYSTSVVCYDCSKILDEFEEEGPKDLPEEIEIPKEDTSEKENKETEKKEDTSQETKKYNTYVVDTGDGTAEVEGYYDEESARAVFDLLNEYRRANGLNELNWASNLEGACDMRAYESAYSFDHERPNGTRWYTIDSSHMNGENLALGYVKPESVMAAWKNSPGHNENMLYPTFKSVAISCFRKISYSPITHRPMETVYYVQTFSCYR